MKIGGILSICNVEDIIADFLRHYLDTHQLDVISVVDCGSEDLTLEKISELNDQRIDVMHRPLRRCHTINKTLRLRIIELINRHHCDLVVPLNVDDFLISRNKSTLRRVLDDLNPDIFLEGTCILSMPKFIFYESALDNPAEKQYLNRLRYCTSAVCDYELILSAPWIKKSAEARYINNKMGNVQRDKIMFDHDELCCFSYPMINLKHARAKTLTLVERLIVETNGRWLYDPDADTREIQNDYHHIKNDTYDRYYMSNYYLSEQQLHAGLRDGSIAEMTPL